jgi:amino acid permease
MSDNGMQTLVQPMLGERDEERSEESPVLASDTPSGLASSTVVLIKTIIGAGSAALPFAFAQLGSVISIVFLILVALSTHWSIQAITGGLLSSESESYPKAVHALVGPGAAIVLELCLVVRCAGLLIVYIVIAADILAGGQGDGDGIVCELIPSWHPLCAHRTLISGVVVVVILAPAVAPRSLRGVTTYGSILGLAAVGVWGSLTLLLLAASVAAGVDHRVPWFPFSHRRSFFEFDHLLQLIATLPVIATAFTCQMTVAAIARELRNCTSSRMSIVSGFAVSISLLVFTVLSSVAIFGLKGLPADIMKAFHSQGAIIELLGSEAGRLAGIVVRFGFLLCVLSNVPLQMIPLRQSFGQLIDLFLDSRGKESSTGGRLEGPRYWGVTYGSLGLVYLVAMSVETVWTPLQLVGATAGAAIAFYFPAMLLLKKESRDTLTVTQASVLLGAGLVQLVTGIAAVALGHGETTGQTF